MKSWLTNLEYVPFDDWSSWIFQSLLPMFESGFIFFVLAPSKLDLTNGISTTNQVVVADLNNYMALCLQIANYNGIWWHGVMPSNVWQSYRDIQCHSLHLHFFDYEHEWLVPVRIQITTLYTCLLLLADSLTLGIEKLELDIGIWSSSDVHLFQFSCLQHSD